MFVAPNWMPIVLEADEDAVLFSFSDRAAQQHLGFWREDAALREAATGGVPARAPYREAAE